MATNITFVAFSTICYEAICLGKPCISLQPNSTNKNYLSALTNKGVIPAIYSEQKCKNAIRKGILNDNYKKQLIKNASQFKSDGKVTERVTKLVYKLLE